MKKRMRHETMALAVAGFAALFAAMVTGCASVEYSSTQCLILPDAPKPKDK